MTRLIPKNTKVKMQFYKGITAFDVSLGIASLTIIALVLASNLTFRFYLAIGVLALVAPLFIRFTDERVYMCVVYAFRHLITRKQYDKTSIKSNMDEIVPYAKLVKNAILNKDGTFTGAIEVKPIEFRMMSTNKQDYLIDGVLTNVFNTLGIGQQMSIVKVERPLLLDNQINAEFHRISDLVSAKENKVLSEQEYSARMDIVQDRMGLIDELNSSNPVKYSSFNLVLFDNDYKSLSATMDYIVRTLSANSIDAKILKNKELVSFLRYSVDSDFDSTKLNGVKTDSLLDYAKPDTVKIGLTSTCQNGRSLSHFVVSNYPLSVGNAWGEELFDIPNTKVVMKLVPVDKSKAIRRIDNAVMEVASQNQSGKASRIIDKETHISTLTDLLEKIQNGNEAMLDTTVIVTVYDEKGKNTNKKAVKRKLRELGLTVNEMFGRQADAYLTSIISTYDKVKISRGMQSSVIAAAFPFVSNEVIDDGGLLFAENKLPVFIDFFKRDSEYVNSNMVIIGKSGSGKSYATKTLLSHFASCNTKLYVLDPEGEYPVMTKNLGGKVLDIASSKYGKINPFHIISTLDDDNTDGTNNSFFAHLQFLEEFYKLILQGINSDSLELLNKLTVELYNRHDIYPETDTTKLVAEKFPIFDDLAELIDEKISTDTDGYNQSCLKILSNYIAKFKTGGRNSNLWNGATSFSPEENFLCFNFQRLLANKNNTVANAQMLIVLKWLENEVIKNREFNQKNGTDRKIVVVIDEAHVFIDEKFPIALDFMYQLAKRIRKYNGMQIVITQNIKDFAGTPEIARKSMAIINVSQYSLIFSLSPNDMSDLCTLYEKAGQINEAESDNIVHNARGSAFFITSPNNRTNINIFATPYVESLFKEN